MKIDMKRVAMMLIVPLMVLSFGAYAQEGEAKVYIISPKDGDVVEKSFVVQFGLKGKGIAPAGVVKANTGHHHLLIDGEVLPLAGKPMGSEVRHFGAGQTEVTLTLPKGEHSLQLILGDYNHVPFDPPVVSEKIHIRVE